MNKKVWLGFPAVFITFAILDYIVNSVILGSTYASITLWRSDMMSKMWIFYLLTLVGSFFFTFIFSKGYENKGIAEGVRYGTYIGIWMNIGKAYGIYAMIAIPYSLALQWFIYGIIEYIIAGVVLVLVFGMTVAERAGEPQAKPAEVAAMPQRISTKELGIGVCILGTIVAILFPPLEALGVKAGWHFIFGDAGLGYRNYQFIDTGLLAIELVLVNGIGVALFLLGRKAEKK